MSIVGVITAGAAGLAAILSAINLYLSGRRELDRWTREALVEAVVKFLDTSFRLKSHYKILLALTPQAEAQIQQAQAKVVAAHDLETETLTRLRLLAPSNVVIAAETLHEADHAIIDTYFTDSREVAFGNALIHARRAREQFIENARLAFRIRDTAAISHRHGGTSWDEFRDRSESLSEGTSSDPALPSPSSVPDIVPDVPDAVPRFD